MNPAPPVTRTLKLSTTRLSRRHARASPHLLCERVAENLREYAGGELEIHAVMVDFDTLEPVGASPGALEMTTWRGA